MIARSYPLQTMAIMSDKSMWPASSRGAIGINFATARAKDLDFLSRPSFSLFPKESLKFGRLRIKTPI